MGLGGKVVSARKHKQDSTLTVIVQVKERRNSIFEVGTVANIYEKYVNTKQTLAGSKNCKILKWDTVSNWQKWQPPNGREHCIKSHPKCLCPSTHRLTYCTVQSNRFYSYQSTTVYQLLIAEHHLQHFTWTRKHCHWIMGDWHCDTWSDESAFGRP